MSHEDHECGEHCIGPDYIERMERGLAGPRITIPNGMTAEEIGEFFNAVAEEFPNVLIP